MASVVVNGDTSGAVTLSAPAVAGTVTVTLPSTSGVMAVGGGTITTLTTTSDITVQGVTVGRGAGAVSTNTAVGASALAANSSGTYNSAVGYQSSQSIQGGGGNVSFGGLALRLNVSGDSNAAFGVNALENNTGSNNTGIGRQALGSNTTASNNTAVGYRSLYSQTNPLGTNTAFGYQAGYGVTTGYDNLLLGDGAGYVGTALTTGQGNICIGTSTRTSAATSTNQINIGYGLTGQGDSNVTLGSFSGKIYNAYTVNATWTQTSDARLKTNIQNDTLGLSFINRLRPVKFNWKASNEIDQGLPYYNETNQRDTETVIHGLIAQEVKAALDAEGVDTFAGWDMGADGIQAISREMFISPLIKAIQELKAELDTAKAQIAALQGA